MEWNETSGSLLRHQQHWVSKNVMIHLRHLLYGSENCLSKMLFSNPFPQKALRLWIWKIVIWIRSKNPQRVWILCIHDPFLDLSKKTQNPFLDSEFRIYIFPPKNAALNTGRTKCGGGGGGGGVLVRIWNDAAHVREAVDICQQHVNETDIWLQGRGVWG